MTPQLAVGGRTPNPRKDIALSIVAGVMIMFDRPFQVGDRVSFGGEYGDVTVIGLRSVKLRTLDEEATRILLRQHRVSTVP